MKNIVIELRRRIRRHKNDKFRRNKIEILLEMSLSILFKCATSNVRLEINDIGAMCWNQHFFSGCHRCLKMIESRQMAQKHLIHQNIIFLFE